MRLVWNRTFRRYVDGAKILVACEYSGRVRDAFARRGHYAVSCDLLPSETPGWHIQGNVRRLLRERWDMVIAHPPCTYLSNSGAHWLHRDPSRWPKMQAGAEFFLECLNANADRVAVENPIMHGYAVEIIGQNWKFNVQPWMFGENYSKRTCFWTRRLPKLYPTSQLTGDTAEPAVWRKGETKDRAKVRSLTYHSVAEAMADQWGTLLHMSINDDQDFDGSSRLQAPIGFVQAMQERAA